VSGVARVGHRQRENIVISARSGVRMNKSSTQLPTRGRRGAAPGHTAGASRAAPNARPS